MATVDTKKMKEIATNMSSAVHELNENIQKLVEATKSAQALKDTARGYDGKELTGNEERTTYGKDDDKLKIVKYYAHVNNSEGGMCSSGMRSITGAPKEYAFLQINKILDLTDADIDAVIESINSNIDEVETTLAKLEGQNATGSNQATDSNQSTDTNQATETGDNSGGNDYPSGGGGGSTGGGGGGSTGGTPQYKKTSTEKPSTTPSTKPKTKSNDNTTRTNNSNNITFTNTSNNSSSTVKPNNSTTTTADKPSSTTPTTETNSDNPTPSASVVLGNSNKGTSSPNYTNGENNTTNTEIEVLGEEPPIKTPNPEDLGDSIINGISRVIPGIKSGEKVQTGSALIPGAAGITAAAAAGLGSKAVLDRSDNLLSIQNDDDDEDDNENHSNKDDETTKKKKNSDDKGWLYGMGVGLGAVGAAAAKNKYDKEKEEEDYGIADDTPEEPETLEDD